MAERKRRRSMLTPEGNENQLISQAYDLASRQMAEGTASAQVITHFLKLGSTREGLEQEKLKNENLVLSAKAKNIESAGRMEALYEKALDAMRSYSGQDSDDAYDD